MTFDDLGRKPCDLLVIGGGAHGLFAAADAASRGLSVALIDRSDFGDGTAWPDQRTIGGGFEAFRGGHPGRARRRIAEGRTWARLAPHLLRPLPFLSGTYRWTRRSRALTRSLFKAYDVLGRSRNAHVSPELHLPKARLESAAATRRLFPGIPEAGLTGGAIWYDYQARHPERLTWTVALAARREGATLVNYVEAIGALRSGGRLSGVRIRDVISGAEGEVGASAMLITTSATSAELLATLGVSSSPAPLLRTMDVLIDRPARDIALVAAVRPGSALTAVPWHGRLLVGTHFSKGPVDAHAGPPPDEAIDAFLGELNGAFPHLSASRQDIRLLSHGLVPALVAGDRVDRLREPRVVRHTGDGAGLVSLLGAEYTTARWAAEQAVDAVLAELGRSARRSRTGDLELPHAGIADVEGRLIETLRDLHVALDRDVVEHLIGWYGTEASDVVRSAAASGLLDRISPAVPVLTGEVAYAIDQEAAVRLSDVVMRRTPLGAAGHPGQDTLTRAARVMGDTLGWTAERTAAEIAAVEGSYVALTASER